MDINLFQLQCYIEEGKLRARTSDYYYWDCATHSLCSYLAFGRVYNNEPAVSMKNGHIQLEVNLEHLNPGKICGNFAYIQENLG